MQNNFLLSYLIWSSKLSSTSTDVVSHLQVMREDEEESLAQHYCHPPVAKVMEVGFLLGKQAGGNCHSALTATRCNGISLSRWVDLARQPEAKTTTYRANFH